MARKRTTRQLLIDMVEQNEKDMEHILARLEAITGTYSDDAPEHSIKAAEVLETAQLTYAVLQHFTAYVRSA